MNIFVTGATGFVGVNAVEKLSKIHNVFAFVRNYSKAKPILSMKNVHIVFGDILNKDSIKNALLHHEIDAVLHIAGLIKSHYIDNLYLVNKKGSQNVANAAKNAGIDNIVYVSSLAARGPSEKNTPVSHYGYSKRHGEYEFVKYFSDKNLKIIRPPIIYGPNEKEFFTLFKMAKIGVLPMLEDRYCSFIYIDDLVDAVEKLIELKNNSVKVYHISDGYEYLWGKVCDFLFESVGKKGGIKIKMNEKKAKLIAYATYFLKDSAPFTFDKVNEIKALKWCCSYENLKNDIGFTPQYSIKEGFKKTYEWYVKNGWI